MRLALHWKILIGLALGVAVGLTINLWWTGETWSRLGVGDPAAYLAGDNSDANQGATPGAAAARLAYHANDFIGKLFIRCLRFIAVPIILFSLIIAAGSVSDLSRLGRIGLKTTVLFLCTAVASVAVGLTLANLVRPGEYVSVELRERLAGERAADAADRIAQAEGVGVKDLLLSMVPTNPFDALARGDMMQVVVFSIAVGVALALIPRPKAAPVLAFFDGLTEAIITLVGLIMKVAPVAVFCLIAPVVATMGLEVLRALFAYCLVVIGGLLIVLLVLYPVVLRLFSRMTIRDFFRGIAPALLLAFSSSSSAATLPVTIACVRNRLGVSEEVTSFVCSLGTTVNMDGTALMQSVAAIFIAQLYAQDLSMAQQLIIVLTAVLAAIGSPGIPSGGIVMLVVVLQSVGLNVEGIAIILAVDRILDMCRTVVNVTGDALAAVVVAGSEGELPGGPPEITARSILTAEHA